ncbi:hypothetical protein CPB83DRAFT_944566 [Crepidotus variabilis]|uniref:Uncharacterized protein n=1 Tax=Crepidotus variabilis TaxID=179855 RepID=A0A9P6E981_9AGAR|nr:hypothetical protein CPB83DRAFT_944566 [Crepidotus variabilis]
MPKNTFIPKPRLEKLPLAVRKDLRDNFETKKADWESEIAGQLGFPLSINFDAQAIWPYAEENGATGAGTIFAGYIDGFMYALKSYIENFGNLGREYFKHAVTNNELSLIPNEKGDDAEAITADVKDGVFRIVFHYKRLGYNQSWLNDPFIKAIDQAPHEGFSLTAKHSIEAHYNEEIEDVHEAIAKILNLPDVKLDPSFDENYAKLLKKDDQSWQSNFGKATLEYFRYVLFLGQKATEILMFY